MAESASDDYPKYQAGITYSPHSPLNTLQTCQLRPASGRGDDDDEKDNDGQHERLWIVYIHGGAWFDPHQTASTFDKAQDMLVRSSVSRHVEGLASVNYRLSPPGPTVPLPHDPSDPARNAKHPDHIGDVIDAIAWLQRTFGFGERYILVGHSCGAALAFQVAMRRRWSSASLEAEAEVQPPLALLGIEGLYDLPALVRFHAAEPLYGNFVKNAFGSDEAQWKAVSPTSSDLAATWKNGKLAVIAHSHEDELVEWEQAELISRALHSQNFTDTGNRKVSLLELKGRHDQVWEEGTEVARAIEFALRTYYTRDD